MYSIFPSWAAWRQLPDEHLFPSRAVRRSLQDEREASNIEAKSQLYIEQYWVGRHARSLISNEDYKLEKLRTALVEHDEALGTHEDPWEEYVLDAEDETEFRYDLDTVAYYTWHQDTGNKVSRKSIILGSQNIILGGKTVIQADCLIRGDLRRPGTVPVEGGKDQVMVAVAVGRYCIFSPGCTLQPPSRLRGSAYSYFPLKIGDHVFVGPGAVVRAAQVGNYVHIGAGSVIGDFCILKVSGRALR
jgi:carbonic anhydrase/acetyltransferase-like protein (isoleucine patch superfamily)